MERERPCSTCYGVIPFKSCQSLFILSAGDGRLPSLSALLFGITLICVMFLLSPPKPQFASWLLRQLETGQYSGLCYVGHNRFRVPWKHNSRKDCRDEDCEIFRVSLFGLWTFPPADDRFMAVLTSHRGYWN